MEKILVTGGAGYLGSVLVPELLAAGHEVTVLDSLVHGQPSLLPHFVNPRLRFVTGDVTDHACLERHLAEASVVIPLAALVGAPLCDRDPARARAVNLEAIEHIAAHLRPGQKVLFPNTNSGYGVGEADELCTEESPLRPVSLYGRTKVEAEAALLATGQAVSFRLATVFGLSPRMRLDLMVNDFTWRAFHDRCIVLFEEDFRRNFIHVRDVARAFLHGLEHHESMKGQAFNVGLSSANLTKRQLAEKIQEQVPAFEILSAPLAKDPDKRDYLVSNARLEATGFAPAHGLEEGIRELLAGFAMLRPNRYANV